MRALPASVATNQANEAQLAKKRAMFSETSIADMAASAGSSEQGGAEEYSQAQKRQRIVEQKLQEHQQLLHQQQQQQQAQPQVAMNNMLNPAMNNMNNVAALLQQALRQGFVSPGDRHSCSISTTLPIPCFLT